MTENEKVIIVVALVVNLITFAIGVVSGSCTARNTTDSRWQQEAVERGYAEYNNKTGEWQWIQDDSSTTTSGKKKPD